MAGQKLYIITNTVNKKVYVGKTSQTYLSDRWKNHLYRTRNGFDTYLYRAMRKHGPEVFKINPLVSATLFTNIWINEVEKVFIAKYKSNQKEFGYNLTIGGEGAPHSEETKKKISVMQIGRPAHNKGVPQTKEQKIQNSLNVKAAWAAGKYENRKRRSLPSLDTRKKQSIAMKKVWENGSMLGATGKVLSNETRQKMSVSQRSRRQRESV